MIQECRKCHGFTCNIYKKRISQGYDAIHFLENHGLFIRLLVSSADNTCKHFGPDPKRQNVGPDLASHYLDFGGIPEIIFENNWF